MYVWQVPLTTLQRRWYRRVLAKGDVAGDGGGDAGAGGDGGGGGDASGGAAVVPSSGGVSSVGAAGAAAAAVNILSATQLMHRFKQLQKVVNHPRTVLKQLERDRLQLSRDAKAAQGSQYVAALFFFLGGGEKGREGERKRKKRRKM